MEQTDKILQRISDMESRIKTYLDKIEDALEDLDNQQDSRISLLAEEIETIKDCLKNL